MLKKLLYNAAIGIGAALVIFCLANVIVEQIAGGHLEMHDYAYSKRTLASILIGLGFGLPAIVYDDERLSLPVQTLIHLAIGTTVLAGAALYGGLLPVQQGAPALIGFFIINIVIFFALWAGIYLYYRKTGQEITRKLKEYQKK